MEICSYDTIKKDTQWVAKMTNGRYTGTYDDLAEYRKSRNCRDFDILAKQPTPELQHFWDAFHKFGHDYMFLNEKDFYDQIYSKCPHAFDKKPETRSKVTTLSKALKDKGPTESVMIENCGNHHTRSWLDALKNLNRDYDVINITKYGNTYCYTLAGTEEELQNLASVSNSCACGYLAW